MEKWNNEIINTTLQYSVSRLPSLVYYLSLCLGALVAELLPGIYHKWAEP